MLLVLDFTTGSSNYNIKYTDHAPVMGHVDLKCDFI